MLDSTKKNLLLYIAYQALLFHERSFAIDPDGVTCFGNQEISYFCDAKLYKDAKNACEDKDSVLVKIDSANKTQVIDSMIDKVECRYTEDVFIGAQATPHPNHKNDGSKRIWKWLDGSKIFLPNKEGYQNWETGQPNDVGGREDCIILDKYTKKWKDSPCNEKKHYICQKNTTIHIEVIDITDGKRCEATAGPCVPNIRWQKAGEIVSSISSHTIYQNIKTGSTILRYKNATIGDIGEYICFAWVAGDEANKILSSVDIVVNGTPEIKEIKSFICNNSLHVLWEPNLRSLGFLHRIITTKASTNETVYVTEITPNEVVMHFTEVSGLNPSAKYNITVVAYAETNNCTDEYAATKTATALGIIVKVSNATLQQTNTTDNDTCVVTWEGIHDYDITSYQITIHNSSLLESSKNNTRWNDTITGTNYSFTPIPDQTYKVDIQPVANESYCPQPLKAVGSCVGKNHDIVNEEGESKQTNALLIIIPSSAVGCVVVLAICIFVFCKRKRLPNIMKKNELRWNSFVIPKRGETLNKFKMKSSRESTAGMTTNPIYGVTDYGNLHSSSNYQDVRDQEEAADGECSTTKREDLNEEKDGSSDVAIYAVVNKPGVKRVDEKDSSEASASNTSGKKSAQSTENMVANPIYDMEPSTSQSTGSDNDQKFDRGPADTDQQSSTDDPIYSAVKKVKIKKNKKAD